MNPWAVTPSASYRFHARTSSRARSISVPLGGASRSFRTIASSFFSTASCSTPGIRVADTVRRDGSRRSSKPARASEAIPASTSPRYSRFARGVHPPAPPRPNPRQPPRTPVRTTIPGTSGWAHSGIFQPTSR